MTPRPKIDDILKDFKDFKKKYEEDYSYYKFVYKNNKYYYNRYKVI